MTINRRIPFTDLVTPHQKLEEELVRIFRTTLATAEFIGGPMVEDFEREFAAFCETRYCIGVSSGTDALRLALIAVGVGPGDSVITVPQTFVATTEAITQAGARPTFVDIDERTYTMDAEKLREYLETQCEVDPNTGRAIHRRTLARVNAVIPVHLYGQTAEMDPILELAEQYRLIVIEDACQAHGAEYFSSKENRWKKAGSIGHMAAFSFYPAKNLGACGEAGAVTTNDEGLARRVCMLRDHGQARKYHHEMEGYNARLDAIQAGILCTKLKHLPAWNRARRTAADRYRELFSSLDSTIRLPHEPLWARAVYHLYVIRAQNRDQLRKHLAKASIGTGIHYPIPLHLQKAYQGLGYNPGDFPVAERATSEILSLPMYPGLTTDQQAYIVDQVTACVGTPTVKGCPVTKALSLSEQDASLLG
jgi:dTDP-4-amino-4,6-dideoxygalactose transaminase